MVKLLSRFFKKREDNAVLLPQQEIFHLRMLQSFLMEIPYLIWVKDKRGKYLYMNENFRQVFSIPDDWQGKVDFDFFPKEFAEQFQKNDAYVLNNNLAIETIEYAPRGNEIDYVLSSEKGYYTLVKKEKSKIVDRWYVIKFPIAIGTKKVNAGLALNLDGKIFKLLKFFKERSND